MNYIEQMNAFSAQSAGILSPGATALYVRLFMLNNQHHWAEYFPATLALLQAVTMTGSINTIRAWQKELEDKGFIECKRGGHKKPNLYKLPKLYISNTDTKTDTKTDTNTDTNTDTKTDSIKKEKEKEKNTPHTPQGRSAPEREKRFDEFWQAYPKKVGKGAALKAYAKLKPTEQLHKAMMLALSKQKKSEQWRKERGRYIPNPATWLNQTRWEDDLSTGGSYGEGESVASYAQFQEKQERRRRMELERDEILAELAERSM